MPWQAQDLEAVVRAERSRALEAEKRAAAAEAYLQVTRTGDRGKRGFSRSFSRSFSRILFALDKVCVGRIESCWC